MAIKTGIQWLNALTFDVETNEHHQFMDAKKEFGGKNRGPNPKEYVLAGLCGCTGMDIISLLKKFKVNFTDFRVDAESETTTEHPKVFKEIHLYFKLTATEGEEENFKKAVDYSMTKYCGVSAMLVKAAPIYYHLIFNNTEIHAGQSKFES